MNPSTIKLLGTLEVLYYGNSFVWETQTQGELNLCNLISHFVNPTDIELVFEHWQNIETWGTPTNQDELCWEYAPPRSERYDDWNEEIENQRQEYYQQLQQLLKTSCHNIQAYNLRVTKSKDNGYERRNPDFSVSIIVAQTLSNHWFCLAPTVPNQVNYSGNRKTALQNQSLQNPNSEIKTILTNLTPIEIYGYYDGGYDETYQHYIVSIMGKSKNEIIASALQSSNMITIESVDVEYSSNYLNGRKISQFMNQCLKSRTEYEIGFWDIGYTYEVGQTPAGDWIGITSQCEFEYNP